MATTLILGLEHARQQTVRAAVEAVMGPGAYTVDLKPHAASACWDVIVLPLSRAMPPHLRGKCLVSRLTADQAGDMAYCLAVAGILRNEAERTGLLRYLQAW